jgi:hypothetical protein
MSICRVKNLVSISVLAALVLFTGCLGRDYEEWYLTPVSHPSSTQPENRFVTRQPAFYGSMPGGWGTRPGFGTFPGGRFGTFPFGTFPGGTFPGGTFPSGTFPHGVYPGYGTYPGFAQGTFPSSGTTSPGGELPPGFLEIGPQGGSTYPLSPFVTSATTQPE